MIASPRPTNSNTYLLEIAGWGASISIEQGIDFNDHAFSPFLGFALYVASLYRGLAVEFDMYRNPDLGELSGNHISVHVPPRKGGVCGRDE